MNKWFYVKYLKQVNRCWFMNCFVIFIFMTLIVLYQLWNITHITMLLNFLREFEVPMLNVYIFLTTKNFMNFRVEFFFFFSYFVVILRWLNKGTFVLYIYIGLSDCTYNMINYAIKCMDAIFSKNSFTTML